MKKIKEGIFGRSTKKVYDNEQKVNILKLIKQLLESEVYIKEIKVTEGVELDMQSIGGMSYEPQKFIDSYEYIVEIGRDLGYIIFAVYNNVSIQILTTENSSKITILTPEPSIELDEVLNSKRNSSFGSIIL